MPYENMDKILDKDCLEAVYNTDLSIIEARWKNIGTDLEDDEFQECILEFVALCEKYKSVGFISDTTDYHIVMNMELQEWHDTKIIPRYLNAGVHQAVFILNEELLVEVLSIEQTFEEEQALAMKIDFVDSLENARLIFA